MARRLILASASAARAALLRGAGLTFETVPASVDESSVLGAMRADSAGADTAAETLAALKAARISAREPEALVIGADQILVCGNAWFEKPADMDAARAQLAALRGKEHSLVTAVCAALGGSVIWRHNGEARLVMRPFSDRFLDEYVAACGEGLLTCVGAYRIEERGVHLFSRIDGDWFTILGLPLLPLLPLLREHGVATA